MTHPFWAKKAQNINVCETRPLSYSAWQLLCLEQSVKDCIALLQMRQRGSMLCTHSN